MGFIATWQSKYVDDDPIILRRRKHKPYNECDSRNWFWNSEEGCVYAGAYAQCVCCSEAWHIIKLRGGDWSELDRGDEIKA